MLQAERWTRRDGAWTLILLLAVALLFLGAPHGGAFYWSDSPRHALNGVFVKDLVQAHPFADPQGYAYAYYAKYPALTILFYPPLFYALSAPFYALFGVTQEAGLAAVFVHYVALALGAYRLARLWRTPAMSAVFALLLVLAPEVAFWGRQVMLEVPAFAFLIWSAVHFSLYRQGGKSWRLYAAIVLLVLAMYTKITTAFLVPVYALSLLWQQRLAVLKNRHIYFVSLLALIGLVPLIVLTLKFGQANVQSVAGVADAEVSRASLAGWLWYLRQMPGQMGWPALLAAIAALAGLVAQWRGQGEKENATGDTLFWAGWLVVGYLFFSAIDLKEARHSIFILPPLWFAIATALDRLPAPRLSYLLGAAVVLATAAVTVFWRPVFYVTGYAEAADYIARVAPKDSVVLFSGYRDGAFVFNMRTHGERRDLSTLRADKLLLKVAVRRELGVEQKDYETQQIADMISRNGVHYVVMQPGFWTDLAVMKRFEDVMASAQFEPVKRIPTLSNFPAHEHELIIYRNKGDVANGPIKLELDLPIIQRKIDSSVGGGK